MASLTSARARKGAATTATSSSSLQAGTGAGNGREIEYDSDKDKDKQQQQVASPNDGNVAPLYGASATSRPFGSNVPAGHGHGHSTSTSGWITSGQYVDKGKSGRPGKQPANSADAHGHARGPLRDYGGGLGVVGPGEFKLLLLITILASVVRLWRLDRPTSVVFDEVHFGGQARPGINPAARQWLSTLSAGFATKYIKQKFFMDVHPPLAKLLLTFAAWFAGFRGNFDFKDIGKYV
jgi:dolichyl-phosphate-mannose-protein mannosyltransferase